MPSKMIAETATIGRNVTLGKNVRIMEHAVVRDNTNLEDNVIIGPYSIIGEYQQDFYYDVEQYENPSTKIGTESIIRSHAVIYSGTAVGKNFRTGHHIVIRENSYFGDHCLFGNFCQTDESITIGDYVRCHSRVFLTRGIEIGGYSCLYPNVITTDVRYPPYREGADAPKVGKRVVLGAGTLLLSGISIGDGAFIAAGSLVTRDIPGNVLAQGRPAQVLRSVEEIQVVGLEIKTPYPFDESIIHNWEHK